MAAIPLVESVQISSQSRRQTPPVDVQLPKAAHHNQLATELNHDTGAGKTPSRNLSSESEASSSLHF
jgi:hypothetical protein